MGGLCPCILHPDEAIQPPLPCPPGGWGGPHTIRWQDIVPAPGGLQVTIASSKTIKTGAQAVAFFVPSILDSPYCPVAAFLTRPGAPLTTRELTSTLRDALLGAGLPHASRYTLHGLRRGAAQVCAA